MEGRDETVIPEAEAKRIFQVAIRDHRCAELLEALFDGAAVTVDDKRDCLVILNATGLEDLRGNPD